MISISEYHSAMVNDTFFCCKYFGLRKDNTPVALVCRYIVEGMYERGDYPDWVLESVLFSEITKYRTLKRARPWPALKNK